MVLKRDKRLEESITPVSEKMLNKFYEISSKFWKENDKIEKKEEGRIYVANFWSSSFANCFPRILYAKGMQENIPAEVVILRDAYNRELKKFYEAFGCKGIFFRRMISEKKGVLLKGMLLTILFWLTGHSGNDLLKLKYKNIKIGEDIYEHIVRKNSGLYSIDKLVLTRDFKSIVLCYCIAICSYNIFEKNPPLFYLCMDTTYIERITLRLAANFNAQIIQMMGRGIINIIKLRGNEDILNWQSFTKMGANQECIRQDYRQYIKEYFEKRFSGLGDKEAKYAFKGKKILEKQDFLKRMHINNGKKNVFIMAHCFTDAARSSNFLLYRDYYNWLEETLKIASTITDVNWIVKAHPTRKHYGEGDEVLELVNRYNAGCLIYMPDELSTSVVREVADVIVTCMGTAGVELACFGIPVVIAGDAWYAGEGFTIEPKTISEYKRVLQKIDRIGPLDDDQIDTAIRMLYGELSFLNIEYLDWLDETVYESEKNVYTSHDGGFQANNKLLEQLCCLYEGAERICTVEYYKRGRNILNELDYEISQVYSV